MASIKQLYATQSRHNHIDCIGFVRQLVLETLWSVERKSFRKRIFTCTSSTFT